MNFDVDVQNLSLRYRKTEALKNISFTIAPEGVYGLLGRNGAGKTSLLSLLASFLQPSSGTIRIAGEDPFENPRIMPHVAFVYSADYSHEYESAENYFSSCRRYRPNFDITYARELAERFEVPLNQAIMNLSTGQQSSLNVVLGLAARCPITMFDEVHLGMDAPTRQLFYQEILDERERFPRSFILSTHLVSEMEYLFDHVIILDKGTLLIDEPADELLNRGSTVTGTAVAVEEFVAGRRVLTTRRLGATQSSTLYGELDQESLQTARSRDLEIGPVSIQDLFIHLTQKEKLNEDTE